MPLEAYTFGCRANQYQTDLLKNSFDLPDDACLINTCCVTEDAARTSRRAIRRALIQGKKVFIAGCLAKLAEKQLKEEFPKINLMFLPDSIWENGIQKTKAINIRANLMVQDGCEHFCSYCIVPYTRGHIRSKPIETALAEAEVLVKAGAKEIVLTGINLGTYQYDLIKLITKLSSIPNLSRIRLSSIEPMYFPLDLVETIRDNPKVCLHLHLPLQSGSDTILKAMGRNYSVGQYLKIINFIKSKIPDCAISSDMIVGFPGECEKDFQASLELAKEISFCRLHTFSYSKRKGTAAAELPGQIDPKVKKERNTIMRQLSSSLATAFAKKYSGQEVEILVEQKGIGFTSNYIKVKHTGSKEDIGQLIKVAIVKVGADYCEGKKQEVFSVSVSN